MSDLTAYAGNPGRMLRFPGGRPKFYETYFRLHGRSGYRSRYDAKDLQKVLEMCEGKTYGLFNHRFMFEDGIEYLRRAQARSESA